MEYVILGLLLIRSLTQYDMKNALEKKVSPFFSASLGSIQAALKKLESNGHVEFTEIVESGRRKKMYLITERGRQYFMDWMLSAITPTRLEQDVTTRLFFLGFMSPANRRSIILAVVTQLEAIVLDYQASSDQASPRAVPKHLEDVVKYQLKTLDLGLFYHQSMLVWFKQFLTELEEDSYGSYS